jgi:lipopolysaccharide biosynthesis regulator YciM
MSTRLILIIIFLAALVLLALIIMLERKRKREPEKNGYIKALYALIEGDRREALENLKRAVRSGERDVGAYILLGDLLRDEGKPEKALQIHRNMSVRRDLSDSDRREIQLAISRDMVALGKTREAIATLENIRKGKNYPGIVFQLHRVYHISGEYDRAYRALERYVKLDSSVGDEVVMSYLTSVGQEFITRGEYGRGAEFADKARGIDRSYAPALYIAGLAYYREGENNRAIDRWLSLLRIDITYLSATLQYIEKMLFEEQKFGRLETILTELYDENKGNPELFRAIISFYERKGEIERIVEYFESEINQLTLDDRLIIRMAAIYLEQGSPEKGSRILRRAAEDTPEAITFKCKNCGRAVDGKLDYCVECGGIRTFTGSYETSIL